MATRPEALPLPTTSDEERQFVASQWQLMWWRFRRHRIGLAATAVIVGFYIVALFSEFFAIHDPVQTDSKRTFVPPQRVHIFDGFRPHPWVYMINASRNPETAVMEFENDTAQKVYINFFTRGHEYKFLGFLWETDIHLMGVEVEGKHKTFYPLGTDRMGRDMWSRIMYGTRISMSIGLVGVAISLVLGLLLGGISGYNGGWTDVLIQRLIEFVRSMPTIPLWLALGAAVPADWSVVKTYFAIVIIISFIGWTGLARQVRGRFLAMREEDFVIAARLYGTGRLRIIFRHMVPSFMSHIIATTTLAIPAIIIAETSLSFLGLGLRPPVMSWGVLLKEAQNLQSVSSAPWLLLPAVVVIVSILAFNFMGDGLRDAADPYSTR